VSTTTDATDQLLAGLNPSQREAVTLPDGPALVIAGAGSGKTRVLTSRIGYLLGEGRARPHEILAITFTNRAAAEMRERVELLVGQSRGMWVMTFHAACGRILRREADRLGYRSNFTIYDQADQVRVVKACLEELGRDPKRFPPRGIHSRISSEKNRLVSAAMFRENIGNFFDQVVADVFELYERRMHASNAMDFDDMMVRTVELLESFDDVRERWQGAFNHLLVDEYQDTNHAQYRIVRLLSDAHRNVMVVGDADQAIYTWRGADIRNILDFERDFPDARVVRLEQNYRSRTTPGASTSGCGARSGAASRFASSRPRTSTTRRASWRRASARSSRAGRAPPRSPSSTARTRSPACSRICSCAMACPTR